MSVGVEPGRERMPFIKITAPLRRLGLGGWESVALLAIALLATALRIWRLDQNGFGTEYYTAGVRSMLESTHNFLYNAFDPAGFLSLDKPPVAFWIQVASAKLFGFNHLSVLLPQAAEGVVSIIVLHRIVRHCFGALAAIFAALFLAITPIAVAVDRSSNTDSCLVMVLLLAAWALTVSIRQASWRWLVVSMALVGVGFNVKMLAAFMVVPGFVLAYLTSAPALLPRKLAHLGIGGLALTVVSLAWVIPFDLTPPSARPYAGSTRGNSMIELAIVQYGLERLYGRGRMTMLAEFAGETPTPQAGAATGERQQPGQMRLNARGAGVLGGSRVAPGLLRLLHPQLAVQFAWLLPLALFGILCPTLLTRRDWPLAPEHGAVILWTGWAAACSAVLSGIEGVFHTYYLVLLAPPLCALAGIGLATLWRFHRQGGRQSLLLPLGLLATAGWQAFLEAEYVGWSDVPAPWSATAPLILVGDWRLTLYLLAVTGAVLAAFGLSIVRHRPSCLARVRRMSICCLWLGGVALLATPAAWSLSTVLARGDVWFPAADLSLIAPEGHAAAPRPRELAAPEQIDALAQFLAAHRTGERFALATITAVQAAPIIVRTGLPVMAVGGYSGSDVIVSIDDLKRMVAQRQVRFFLLAPAPGRGGLRRSRQHAIEIVRWVRENGAPVSADSWRGTAADDRAAGVAPESLEPASSEMSPSVQLFDLSPGTRELSAL